jgi:uncharacterized protein YbgA (DUF1722 family)/uncharacterized protein YbbK (DUF523 family)
MNDKKILIGISSCLLGERVRFDKGHKHQSYITDTLGEYFDFRPFCPEMDIGLGTPRETLRLVDLDGDIKCVGTKTEGHDVTNLLKESAEKQSEWHKTLCGYILKKDSPSCGMERVKVYKGQMPERVGRGLYAATLQDNFPFLPIEEEGRLGDPILRENFIKRVFALSHWKDMESEGWSQQRLMNFHSQYKYVLLAHDQHRTRLLGKFLADSSSKNVTETAGIYFKEWMSILKIRATRKNHVNVLQHLQGFLKQDIDASDREELTELISQYRLAKLPLIVPVTLLKHYFRKHPKPFVENSLYLTPHPSELMLFNKI